MAVAHRDTDTKTYETYSCDGPGCTEEFERGEDVDGSFCTRACSLRDDGQDILSNVKHDHRWCFGCLKKLKEIERPPADMPEFIVGFQYQTRHARHGQSEGKAFVEDDAVNDRHHGSTASRFSLADSLVMTGTICECGTTDHRDDYLRLERVTDIRGAAERLLRVLEWMGHEGQHSKTIDASRLVETLTRTARDDGELDWELAVGRAIDNS